MNAARSFHITRGHHCLGLCTNCEFGNIACTAKDSTAIRVVAISRRPTAIVLAVSAVGSGRTWWNRT